MSDIQVVVQAFTGLTWTDGQSKHKGSGGTVRLTLMVFGNYGGYPTVFLEPASAFEVGRWLTEAAKAVNNDS